MKHFLVALLAAVLVCSPAAAQNLNPTNVNPNDCSGTITVGGAAQNAFTSKTNLRGFTIVNLSTDPMWISFTGTAALGTQGSYLLAAGSATVAGGSFTTPYGFGFNGNLSVIAATTADKFSCTWW